MIYGCAQNSKKKELNPCSSKRSKDFLRTVKVCKDVFLSAEYLCRQIGNPSAWKCNLLTNKYSDSWNHISKILHAEMIWFTVLKCGTNNSHRSRLSVRRSLSFLPTVTRFWLLTFPPHRPYLLSFHSPWAVWCVALLKRLFLPRVVLISNKRGCRTRGGGGSSWHCYSPRSLSPCFSSLRCRELHGPVLCPFRLHSSSSPGFSIRTEANRTHRSSRVSIATPVFFIFYIWHTWPPCWLWSSDLGIKGPFTRSPGGGDRNVCVFPSVCMREREKERERREDEGEMQ